MQTIPMMMEKLELPDNLTLTAREQEVLELLARGETTASIAETLHLSPETILWYRKRLHAKLDVHSAPELVAEVVRRNLL